MKKMFAVCGILFVLVAGCGQRQSADKQQSADKNKNSYVNQAKMYLEQANLPKAIENLDNAIKHDPKNEENYLFLGQIYLRLKNYPRAVDTFTAATRVSPQSGEAYYLLAYSMALNGDFKTAMAVNQQSVGIFAKNKDQERLKRSLTLLKSLDTEIKKTP